MSWTAAYRPRMVDAVERKKELGESETTMRNLVVATGRLCAIAVALSVPRLSSAADTLQTYSYEFHQGGLRIQGGFAGWDLGYALDGGFVLRFEDGPDAERAWFADVDALLSGPGAFNELPLDDLLRLSEMSGTIESESLIRFVGPENQRVMMDVDATHLDIGLRLKGSNTPVPCCDFFTYELEVSAIQVFALGESADFDGDLDVDRNDLDLWRQGMATAAGAGLGSADADGDDDTDGDDYLVWQRQFGGLAMPMNDTAFVPEPSTLSCGYLVAAFLLTRRRRCRPTARRCR